ncbi:hypothetical protein NEHOM01_0916 [Nematocida homosporus]|uniref:uncharacterized protein n=1 Tax=Nematocida homosporus TaxID=1912981 RepID=UPI00221EC3A1|nr:uncharacterized protein NEHOM01_0916 [Nematocida homosporus]KAI5185590.1 hypothetical protein NEHOM01_0916 [Nematocida homosporus]
MTYQQGSSIDHVFERGALDWLGLSFVFMGIFWAIFVFIEMFGGFPSLSYRIAERVGALIIYTSLYIVVLSLVHAHVPVDVNVSGWFRRRFKRNKLDS